MRMVIYYLMQLFNVLFCSAEKQSCFLQCCSKLATHRKQKSAKDKPFFVGRCRCRCGRPWFCYVLSGYGFSTMTSSHKKSREIGKV